jgi:heme-degrading monooxygenase HmoA
MFIAMNRFRIVIGSEAAFEAVWTNRDSHLKSVPGFVEFNLLKGPVREGYVLYSTHTSWESRAAFEDWTRSEAFRAAHRNAGDNRAMYLGPPELELIESVQATAKA